MLDVLEIPMTVGPLDPSVRNPDLGHGINWAALQTAMERSLPIASGVVLMATSALSTIQIADWAIAESLFPPDLDLRFNPNLSSLIGSDISPEGNRSRYRSTAASETASAIELDEPVPGSENTAREGLEIARDASVTSSEPQSKPVSAIVSGEGGGAGNQPLQVDAPYFYDSTPPGSYDFTLHRNGNMAVSVPAPCNGTVRRVWFQGRNGGLATGSGAGNIVSLNCGNYGWLLGHFDRVVVRKGQKVKKGQSLGIQGCTGRCSGPHVHLQIHRLSDWQRISSRSISEPLVRDYLNFVKTRPDIDRPPTKPKPQVQPKPKANPKPKNSLEGIAETGLSAGIVEPQHNSSSNPSIIDLDFELAGESPARSDRLPPEVAPNLETADVVNTGGGWGEMGSSNTTPPIVLPNTSNDDLLQTPSESPSSLGFEVSSQPGEDGDTETRDALPPQAPESGTIHFSPTQATLTEQEAWDDLALDFDLEAIASSPEQRKQTEELNQGRLQADRLFADRQSIGAIAVGHAEGNLTAKGKRTSIYNGHLDPANGIKNIGFCSLQRYHWKDLDGDGQVTLKDADRICSNMLQTQARETVKRFKAQGLDPDRHREAVVNCVDLYNQSWAAGRQCPEKYRLARQRGQRGEKAYVWARVEGFRVSSGRLSASGLFRICRNSPQRRHLSRWDCIASDQRRRVRAVNQAIAQQKNQQ